jgi:hypothetical protein
MIRIFIVVIITLLPDMLRCLRRGILNAKRHLKSLPQISETRRWSLELLCLCRILTNKTHELKCSETCHRKHLIFSTNCYMFRQQGAILRELNKNKES